MLQRTTTVGLPHGDADSRWCIVLTDLEGDDINALSTLSAHTARLFVIVALKRKDGVRELKIQTFRKLVPGVPHTVFVEGDAFDPEPAAAKAGGSPSDVVLLCPELGILLPLLRALGPLGQTRLFMYSGNYNIQRSPVVEQVAHLLLAVVDVSNRPFFGEERREAVHMQAVCERYGNQWDRLEPHAASELQDLQLAFNRTHMTPDRILTPAGAALAADAPSDPEEFRQWVLARPHLLEHVVPKKRGILVDPYTSMPLCDQLVAMVFASQVPVRWVRGRFRIVRDQDNRPVSSTVDPDPNGNAYQPVLDSEIDDRVLSAFWGASLLRPRSPLRSRG